METDTLLTLFLLQIVFLPTCSIATGDGTRQTSCINLKIKLLFVEIKLMVVRVRILFISRAIPLILILISPLNMHLRVIV